jgi:propanol-preferring alcohol dehydrogenase
MVLREPAPVARRPLEAEDRPDPVPGRGEVLVSVSVCGVCHTDLHTVEGDLALPRTPIVPGHQVVGRVSAVGEGATLAVGTRVGIAWLHRACERCSLCTRGLENLCPDARFTGLQADGGYADKTVVPERFAYPLPDAFSDEEAAPLLCAGIIGYRSLRLSGVQPGQRLGLYGFGASAHLTAQLAVDLGCEVYVFTRGDEHRELARELGAVFAGGADDDPGVRMHGSILFAPAGALVPPALERLEPGGALALAGIWMSEVPPLDYRRHLYHERVLRSVANATRRDGHDFLEAAARIPLRPTTEAFPLEQANEALLALSESRLRAAGVLRIGG